MDEEIRESKSDLCVSVLRLMLLERRIDEQAYKPYTILGKSSPIYIIEPTKYINE